MNTKDNGTPSTQRCEHDWENAGSKRQTAFKCTKCGVYTFEQPAQKEIEELTAQRDKLADILTRTANALKGQPADLSRHSWHDLPEVAQRLKAAQQRIDYRAECWPESPHYKPAPAPEVREQPASNVNATGGPKAFFSLAEQPAKCKHNVFAPYRCTQCEAEQPAQQRDLTPEQPAQQQPDELTVWKARAMQAEAVIAKFMEQPAQQQEPVAFDVVCHDCGGDGFDRQDSNYRCTVCNGAGFIEKMLYTSPLASKPWVGLTYEEVKELIEFEDYESDPQGFIEFVEAKLREKNA